MPKKKTAARKNKPAHKTPVKTAHASSPYSRKSSPEGRRQLMLLGLIVLTAIVFFAYLFTQNAPPSEAAKKKGNTRVQPTQGKSQQGITRMPTKRVPTGKY